MTTSSTRAEPEQNDHTRACFPFVLYFLSGHRRLPRHLHATVVVPFADLLSPTSLGEPPPPGIFPLYLPPALGVCLRAAPPVVIGR